MPTQPKTEPRTINIEVDRMIAGLFELFDDLADLALNRVVRRTELLTSGFNPTAVAQPEVDRFKIAWFVILGELMFREIRGGNIAAVVTAYYAEMGIVAAERQAENFLAQTTAKVRDMIDQDAAYAKDGTVNVVEDGNGAGAKNIGLAPDLAAFLATTAFSENSELAGIFDSVSQTVIDELVNAYGQSSIACAPFVVD